MAASYKLHLSDGVTSKTLTENKPKIDGVTDDNFAAAGAQLQKAYNLPLITVGLQSETTVWAAS